MLTAIMDDSPMIVAFRDKARKYTGGDDSGPQNWWNWNSPNSKILLLLCISVLNIWLGVMGLGHIQVTGTTIAISLGCIASGIAVLSSTLFEIRIIRFLAPIIGGELFFLLSLWSGFAIDSASLNPAPVPYLQALSFSSKLVVLDCTFALIYFVLTFKRRTPLRRRPSRWLRFCEFLRGWFWYLILRF